MQRNLQFERNPDVATIQQTIKEREIELDALRAFAEQRLQNERLLLQQTERELQLEIEENRTLLADREGEISKLKNDISKLQTAHDEQIQTLRQQVKREEEEKFTIRWKQEMAQVEEQHKRALDESIRCAEQETKSRIEYMNAMHLESITDLKAFYSAQISMMESSHQAELQKIQTMKGETERELRESCSSLHEAQCQIKVLLQKHDEERLTLYEEKSQAVKKLEISLQTKLAEAQHKNLTQEILIQDLQSEREAMKKANFDLALDNQRFQKEVESARKEVIDKERKASELIHALQHAEASLFQMQQQYCHAIEELQQKLVDANLVMNEKRCMFEKELADLEDRNQEALKEMEVKEQRWVTELKRVYQSEKTLKNAIKRERQVKDQFLLEEQGKAEALQRVSIQLLRKDNHDLSEQISLLIEDNKAITAELRQLKRLPLAETPLGNVATEKNDAKIADAEVRRFKKECRAVILKYRAEKDAADIAKVAAENKVKDLKSKLKCYQVKTKELKRLMSQKGTDKMLVKELNKLNSENCRLRDTVALLRNEMEHLSEMKRSEANYFQEYPVKRASESEPCHLMARMDQLLERLTDFNANIYNFRDESQQLNVVQNRVKEMIAHLDSNISDLSGTLRSSLHKSTSLGCNYDVHDRQHSLEQKMKEMSEELAVVLQDRDALISLSNRLRVDLQRKTDCQCQLRCSNPESPQKIDGVLLDFFENDELNDYSEIKPYCQQATLNNDKFYQKTFMSGKSSERITQSQKESLERIQRSKYIENLKLNPKKLIKVRNWNVNWDESDEEAIQTG